MPVKCVKSHLTFHTTSTKTHRRLSQQHEPAHQRLKLCKTEHCRCCCCALCGLTALSSTITEFLFFIFIFLFCMRDFSFRGLERHDAPGCFVLRPLMRTQRAICYFRCGSHFELQREKEDGRRKSAAARHVAANWHL